METKVCPTCNQELHVSSFKERTKRGVKYLRSSCIECEKKKNKEYYLSRKEELKRLAREYYYENKDKVLEDVREYREKNREMIRKKIESIIVIIIRLDWSELREHVPRKLR